MPVSLQLKNQHLLWRTGFGPAAGDITALSTIPNNELLDNIFKASSRKPEYIDVANNAFDGLVKGVDDVVKMNEKPDKEQQKK